MLLCRADLQVGLKKDLVAKPIVLRGGGSQVFLGGSQAPRERQKTENLVVTTLS